MSEITNKASYLKGLADGLKLDTEKNEGKLISGILDLLVDMADSISELDSEQGFIMDRLSDLDNVVQIISQNIGGGHSGKHTCDCGCDDDDDLYKLICPECGEEISITADDIDEGLVVCPCCDEEIELAFECEDDDCDCGHNHKDK